MRNNNFIHLHAELSLSKFFNIETIDYRYISVIGIHLEIFDISISLNHFKRRWDTVRFLFIWSCIDRAKRYVHSDVITNKEPFRQGHKLLKLLWSYNSHFWPDYERPKKFLIKNTDCLWLNLLKCLNIFMYNWIVVKDLNGNLSQQLQNKVFQWMSITYPGRWS